MKCMLLIYCSTAAAAVLLMAGCAAPLQSGLFGQGKQQLLPDNVTRTRPVKLPGEIEDLHKIPQDVRPFAAALKAPLSAAEQDSARQQFRAHYFSPWAATLPLPGNAEVIAGTKWLTERTWYGENRRKVEPERLTGLMTLAALDRLPSLNQSGIIITPTYIRGLPTIRPLYESADDFPFDQLQYSEVKPNEPVRILHVSADGAWRYIDTSYVTGWVEQGAVKLVDEALRQRLSSAAYVVIVMDFATVRDEQGQTLPQPKIGTLYPLVKEEPDSWLVNVAVAGEGAQATLTTARIAKKDARRHPLPFTTESVALLGNELLKTPYGWGELFRDRDCSATTRDFFLPFGIWLPRNSRKQLTIGPFISLANLTNADRQKLLREQAVPFRTLLHRQGHIMLYVGLMDGKPVVLHNIWALRIKPTDGSGGKFYIGRTILSTLEAGKELPLSRGTILDHLDGMINLPVMEPPPDSDQMRTGSEAETL